MGTRAGRRSMLEARSLRRRTLVANRRLLVTVVMVYTLFAGAVITLMALWRGAEMAWFSAGAATMSFAFLVWNIAESVQFRRLVDGAAAERFTSQSIARLRDWQSVDHVEFHNLDIDHVAAGPGGVFAIETKWTSDSWQVHDGSFHHQWAVKAVDQCSRGAEKIASLLAHQYKVTCDVRPLLVVWGPGRPKLDEAVEVAGVLVVPGPLLKATLSNMPSIVDRPLRSGVIEAIDHFIGIRDIHDEMHGTPVVGWSD